MCCKNILGCVIVIAGIAAGIICVVGIAVPVWSSNDVTMTSSTNPQVKVTTYEGLWQVCTVRELVESSFDCNFLWDNNNAKYSSAKKATLAMCLIGVIAITACVVVMALHMSLCGTIEILTKIAAVLAFTASLFIMIGIIVYGTKVKGDLDYDLSGSWGLCLVSGLLCLVIGVMSCIVD